MADGVDQAMEIFESKDEGEESSLFTMPAALPYQDRQRDPDVVTIDYDPAVSFAKFTQTYLDTNDTDFTDKVNKKIYFNADSAGFSKDRDGVSFASPKERFDRLQAELAEFKTELKSLQDVKSLSQLGKTLVSEAGALELNLINIAKHKKYSHLLDGNYPLTPAHVGLKNASKELTGKIKSTGSYLGVEKKKEEKSSNQGISYEFYGAGSGTTRKISDIVTLDKRMTRLERTLGQQKLQMLPDLRSSVLYLAKKVESLGKDQGRLSEANKKMGLLSAEIISVNKERGKLKNVTTAEHQNRVDELYDMVCGWDQAGAMLPFISSRVQALKDMTDAAKGSNARIDKCVTLKDQMAKDLDSASGLVKEVKKNFADTLKKMGKVSEVEKSFSQIASLAKKLR